MNLPINTCENGSCAFAIRGEYDKRVYAKNIGSGGGHFPATSVCVVYQLRGRMRNNGARPLPQGRVEQLSRNRVKQDADNCGDGDMGGMT